MTVARQSDFRVVGYVDVRVASRVYRLPVAALPESVEGDQKPGFYADSSDRFGIFVDDRASDAVQRETIQQASVEAARHIARKFFN
ncbi:MAG: hypothetical protein ABTD50_14275 [Polyangiaceae bacterium]|jgi:hypothetical protein